MPVSIEFKITLFKHYISLVVNTTVTIINYRSQSMETSNGHVYFSDDSESPSMLILSHQKSAYASFF